MVSDYKVILEQLKSQDEMIIYEAVMNLQQQLSIAQDNTLSNFAVDQYIAVLIEILKRPPMSDFTNEINSKLHIFGVLTDEFSVCHPVPDESHGYLSQHLQ